jgi:hypothetical protein
MVPVDAEHIVVAALAALARATLQTAIVDRAMATHDILAGERP